MSVVLPDSPREPSPEERDSAYRTHRRFDRAARLFTEPGLARLMGARVLVFGLGGVGSFAAEALARSAVGQLVLVDFDEICVTNVNRQLHALKGNIGKRKVDVMAERLRLIHLLSTCVQRGLPVVSSMGAAARLDPTRVRTGALGETHTDPFARNVRRMLRQQHGLSAAESLAGVTAVFSDEEPIDPSDVHYDHGAGFRCVCPNGDNGLHSCEKRSRIEGSASFVVGTFGLTCASVVVRNLIGRAG
jgi:tRNA A37 threonylcarbamoyladenosine dehydratase